MNKLKGTISADVGSMKGLKILSLMSNNLSGSLPSAFEELSLLKELSLQNNLFTGNLNLPISDYLGKLGR